MRGNPQAHPQAGKGDDMDRAPIEVGESLSKGWGGKVCIDSKQTHSLSCLTLMT